MMLVERNGDFVNRSHGERQCNDGKGEFTQQAAVIEQDGIRVMDLDLNKFTSAFAMMTWEFAVYSNYGDARCDEENIETLEDLFGSEFSRMFYLRKNALLAQERMSDADEELRLAVLRRRGLKKQIAEWLKASATSK